MWEVILPFYLHHHLEEFKLPKARETKDIFTTLHIIFTFWSMIGGLRGKQEA